MDAITEKYRDKVTPAHAAAMEAVGMVHHLLGLHREQFAAIIRSKEYMDNVGGLLDPTFYRDALYSKNLKLQLQLCKAALAFLKETDDVVAELKD